MKTQTGKNMFNVAPATKIVKLKGTYSQMKYQ